MTVLPRYIAIAITAIAIAYMALVPVNARSDNRLAIPHAEAAIAEPEPKPEVARTITAMVTGYNTVPEQTDDTPCIAAAGDICGRRDVVACPRSIPLRTWVRIEGVRYQCMDRLHPRYDHRFDISCDKDMACPFRVTGTKTVEVLK